MKVLVTGGSGFIGSYVVQALLDQHFTVSMIDIETPSTNIKNVTYYSESINDKDKIDHIFELVNPDVVIHLAAQVNVIHSITNPSEDATSNITGTIYLLEACVKHKVRKIIYASTAAVYGEPQYLGLDENHPLNPISFYGLSKLTGEQYVELFGKLHGLTYTILRFANAYGPSSSNKTDVITLFARNFINNTRPTIFGDGEQTRDFIYVKDISRATLTAIEHGDNQTFNISTNHPTSLNRLVTLINEIENKHIQPVYKQGRSGDISISYLDNSKAFNSLLWEPVYSLVDGIRETLNHYKVDQ